MSPDARRRAGRRALGAAGALVLDRVAGEPPVPAALHPVAVLGRGIAALEGRIYDDRRGPGAVLTAAGVGVAGAAGAVLRSPSRPATWRRPAVPSTTPPRRSARPSPPATSSRPATA